MYVVGFTRWSWRLLRQQLKLHKQMYWIQTNRQSIHFGLECFVQHSKWSFLINVHVLYVFLAFYQGCEPQSCYLVGYQVVYEVTHSLLHRIQCAPVKTQTTSLYYNSNKHLLILRAKFKHGIQYYNW